MVDWPSYQRQFPAKYWQQSGFDTALPTLVQDLVDEGHLFKSMLDVGGGVTGTECMRDLVTQRGIHTYALDPYVPKPDWIDEAIGWDTSLSFDLIVCRGAINYLTEDELDKLNNALNGVIIFNTFVRPPSAEWQQRPIVTGDGEAGTEYYRLVGNVVEHMLFVGSSKIEHSFFYYSADDFQRHFALKQRIDYSTNSVIFICSGR